VDVRIGAAEFDALANPVCIGWCEFDPASIDEMQATVGGRGKRSSFASTAPIQAPSRYHDRYADEDIAAALAAELDDEEAVLTLLMEIFHAV
jgi:hypothetical protein